MPIALFVMWAYGIFVLFTSSSLFEIIVDLVIIVAVIVIGFILTKLSPREADSE